MKQNIGQATDAPGSEMTHTYSIETLYYFDCCSCKGWWSIRDFKNTGATIACPHCGEVAQYRDKEVM